jgi:hypothetical protein
MKVLIDTNVILDVLCNRPEFGEASSFFISKSLIDLYFFIWYIKIVHGIKSLWAIFFISKLYL